MRRKKVVEPYDVSAELRRMCNVAFDGIIFHERGTVISANATALKLLGYSFERLCGLPVERVISFPESENFPEKKMNLPVTTIDGVVFTAEVVSRRMALDGREIVATSIRDVSDLVSRELNLRHYRELIERIVNNSFDVVMVYSRLNDTVLFVNAKVSELLGHDAEDFLIEDGYLWSIIHPSDVDATRSLIGEIGGGDDKARIIDIRLMDKSGRWVWFETRILIFVMDGTRNDDVLLIFRNVDDLRAAYEQIKESEEIFRGMYENSSVGIVQVAPDGRFIRCNRAYREMLGYTEDELRTMKFDEVTHRDFIEENFSLIKSVIDHETESYSLEKKYIRKDGRLVWASVYASAIRNKNGDIELFVGMVTNIQSRKTYEEKLRFLSLAVEQSPLSIVLTDTEGTILYVNRGFTEITGYGIDEALGKKPSILKSGKHDREFYRELWDTLTSGNMWRGEMINRRKNGEEFWESSILSPITDPSGIITHYMGIKEDITEKKLTDGRLRQAIRAAETANKAKSDFLANMSHEIRTPMNAIVGLSHLLAETELTRVQREYAEKIGMSSEVLLRLVNDILDMAKIEAGKVVFERKPFRVWDLFSGIVSVGDAAGKGESVEYAFIVDRKIPPLSGDRFRVGQILMNLVSNAFKFTERGEITVEASLRERSAGTAEVEFSVRDTGIGISGNASEIFDAFAQADSSITRKYGGTGLGLAISKNLVELMGGSISVESVRGEGSVFRFRVPFAVQEDIAPEDFPSFRGKRVLVLETSVSSRRSLEEILSALGMECGFADTIVEAEKMVSSGAFDFAVIDFRALRPDHGKEEESIAAGCRMIVSLLDIADSADIGKSAAAVVAKPFMMNSVLAAMDVSAGKDPSFGIMAGTESGSILVVDDNKINLIVTSRLLEMKGYRVDTAHDGFDALGKIGENAYDLVITDIQMPGINGFDLAVRIRNCAGYGDVPVIALSADIMSDRSSVKESELISEFIEKPVDPRMLFRVVKQYRKAGKTGR